MGRREGTFLEQSALDLLIADLLVTLDSDLVYLHLHLLIDGDIEIHLILVGHIVALHDGNLSILVTLVVEILLGKNLGTVDHVRRNLIALQQTQFLLHVLTLALLQSDIVDIGNTRTDRQVDMQVDLITDERVGRDDYL